METAATAAAAAEQPAMKFGSIERLEEEKR
jgi:hypothetical protein